MNVKRIHLVVTIDKCISTRFDRKNDFFVGCLDGSDEETYRNEHQIVSQITEPIFGCEDTTCSIFRSDTDLSLSSSCVCQRQRTVLFFRR